MPSALRRVIEIVHPRRDFLHGMLAGNIRYRPLTDGRVEAGDDDKSGETLWFLRRC